tara:strand:- start:301 stop:696 length:396 start_codon:yes stop_codon:yes gene_type:complete
MSISFLQITDIEDMIGDEVCRIRAVKLRELTDVCNLREEEGKLLRRLNGGLEALVSRLQDTIKFDLTPQIKEYQILQRRVSLLCKVKGIGRGLFLKIEQFINKGGNEWLVEFDDNRFYDDVDDPETNMYKY